nr:MAG TPA: hypothetical protein [Caudoviricetes sp.]
MIIDILALLVKHLKIVLEKALLYISVLIHMKNTVAFQKKFRDYIEMLEALLKKLRIIVMIWKENLYRILLVQNMSVLLKKKSSTILLIMNLTMMVGLRS